MNRFLRLKHWQLFIYLLIVPAFFPENDLGTYLLVIYGLLFLIWVLKVDEELYYRIEEKPKINLTLLQINLANTFIYLSIIILFTDGYEISSEKDNYAEYGWKLWVYIPFTFYVLFSYFYALHFTAYSVYVLEKQYFGKTTEYSLLVAALFVFPIGIWWIQPKINRILKIPLENEKINN
jgi:hypothetical protein